VDWKVSNDGVVKRYPYQYDALNRLKKGLYAEPGTSGYFNEELSYDLNGISPLYREIIYCRILVYSLSIILPTTIPVTDLTP